MSEPRRWTIYVDAQDKIGPLSMSRAAVEVMPVSEHEAEVIRLSLAITEHRTAIHNAGPIRVDSRDVPIADAKQKADLRLWAALDQ